MVETLNPPNFWNRTENTPSMTIEQLSGFAEKADFVHRSLNMFFAVTVLKGLPAEQLQPWLDIFHQPVVYPPPDIHPLSSKEQRPANKGSSPAVSR